MLLTTSFAECRTTAFPSLRGTPRALSIARQICAALEHAHSHGIVKRDLEPETVLLAPDGTAKLTGFGLALGGAAGYPDLRDGAHGYRLAGIQALIAVTIGRANAMSRPQ